MDLILDTKPAKIILDTKMTKITFHFGHENTFGHARKNQFWPPFWPPIQHFGHPSKILATILATIHRILATLGKQQSLENRENLTKTKENEDKQRKTKKTKERQETSRNIKEKRTITNETMKKQWQARNTKDNLANK